MRLLLHAVYKTLRASACVLCALQVPDQAQRTPLEQRFPTLPAELMDVVKGERAREALLCGSPVAGPASCGLQVLPKLVQVLPAVGRLRKSRPEPNCGTCPWQEQSACKRKMHDVGHVVRSPLAPRRPRLLGILCCRCRVSVWRACVCGVSACMRTYLYVVSLWRLPLWVRPMHASVRACASIAGCLALDPNERLTADQALAMPYFKDVPQVCAPCSSLALLPHGRSAVVFARRSLAVGGWVGGAYAGKVLLQGDRACCLHLAEATAINIG